MKFSQRGLFLIVFSVIFFNCSGPIPTESPDKSSVEYDTQKNFPTAKIESPSEGIDRLFSFMNNKPDGQGIFLEDYFVVFRPIDRQEASTETSRKMKEHNSEVLHCLCSHMNEDTSAKVDISWARSFSSESYPQDGAFLVEDKTQILAMVQPLITGGEIAFGMSTWRFRGPVPPGIEDEAEFVKDVDTYWEKHNAHWKSFCNNLKNEPQKANKRPSNL